MSLADVQAMKALKMARQLIPYNGNSQVVYGQEYLSAVQKKAMSSTTIKAVFSGDSTTAGDGTTSPYRLHEIFSSLCFNYLSSMVQTYNQGHSGAWTTTWASTYVNDDLALNPDLLVIRWGLNDARTDLDISSYETALRSGLTTIRASRALNSLSIILMTPNNVDSVDFPEKNPKWGKAINDMIRKVARDFKCCFIDTFSIWNDATNGADWMDSYLVHPQNVANTWIASKIFDVVFPRALFKNSVGLFNEKTLAGSTSGQLQVSALPQVFSKGVSFYRTYPSGWVYNGNALTFVSNSDGVLQFNFSNDVTVPNYAVRIGSTATNTWGAWKIFGTPTVTAPTLQNSWVNFGSGNEVAGYYKDVNNVVHLQGLIANGTVTNGTILFNLPAGYRPTNTKWFVCLCNTTTTIASIKISPQGDVVILTGTNGWLSLDGVTFLATQ